MNEEQKEALMSHIKGVEDRELLNETLFSLLVDAIEQHRIIHHTWDDAPAMFWKHSAKPILPRIPQII